MGYIVCLALAKVCIFLLHCSEETTLTHQRVFHALSCNDNMHSLAGISCGNFVMHKLWKPVLFPHGKSLCFIGVGKAISAAVLSFRGLLGPFPEQQSCLLSLSCTTIIQMRFVILPRRQAGDVWWLPTVCNLGAVIWFHFTISSPVLLPRPVTLSVLSVFCLLAHSLDFFPGKFFNIFR